MIILLQLNDMVKNAGKYFSLFEFVKKSNCPISICLQFHFSDLFSSFKRLKNCKFGFKPFRFNIYEASLNILPEFFLGYELKTSVALIPKNLGVHHRTFWLLDLMTKKSVHFQNHFILFSSLKKFHWFYTCSSGLLKSKWGNGQCAYHSVMHWFTPLLREKIQMKVLVRINNLQLFVLWVLSYIHHLCPVTFWFRVSDQSGSGGGSLFCDHPHTLITFQDRPTNTRAISGGDILPTLYDKLPFICVSVCVNILSFEGDDGNLTGNA